MGQAPRERFVAANFGTFLATDLTPPTSVIKNGVLFTKNRAFPTLNHIERTRHPEGFRPPKQRGFTTALCNLGARTLHYTIVFYHCSTSTAECKEDYIQNFYKLRNPAAVFEQPKQHFVQEAKGSKFRFIGRQCRRTMRAQCTGNRYFPNPLGSLLHQKSTALQQCFVTEHNQDAYRFAQSMHALR